MDKVVGIVLIHLDLFEYHATLTPDVLGVNTGFSTRSLKTSIAMGMCSSSTLVLKQTHSLAVKASMLPPMESTCAGDFLRGAMLGPLEHHVLDEMRNPVPSRSSSRDPVLIHIPMELDVCAPFPR